MSDGEFIRRLRRAHRGEVLGEAVYAMAARFARTADQRRKWEALCRLELRTKLQLGAVLAHLGVRAGEATAARWVGGALGVAAALLPWRLTLAALGAITKRSTPVFERLEREGARRQGPSLAGLGAHERAQREFVRRELAGDAARSLSGVHALLGVTAGRRARRRARRRPRARRRHRGGAAAPPGRRAPVARTGGCWRRTRARARDRRGWRSASRRT